MWKKIVLGALIVVLGGLGLAWLNREAVILFIAAHTGKQAVAENRQVDWQQGPVEGTTNPLTRAPNVIFILADDLGYNDISTFGGGVAGGAIQTPNIDRLAREGVIFTNAYSGTASCAPSRAMLMTGRYPTRTGFEFTPTPNGMGRVISFVSRSHESGIPPIEWSEAAAATSPPFEEQGLPGSEVTLAEVLGDAGYHTVHIGKWHLGRGPEFGPNAQGF
ncbi:MAG: sulfatase-like hydrolase/transferase, partial [Henriciella sp.]|nr:sulfatase-like hydrolase/transferase [Henriciella sp.]